jgi:hypothetical protein
VLWLWGRIPLSRDHWVGGVACHLAFSFAIMAGYYLVRIHRSTIVNITLHLSQRMHDFCEKKQRREDSNIVRWMVAKLLPPGRLLENVQRVLNQNRNIRQRESHAVLFSVANGWK